MAEQPQPLVSICIPHWQVKELVTLCLRAIREFTSSVPIEVLVVDNGSQDDSLDYLRQQLTLRFDHQRESLDAKSPLLSELDSKLISRETLATDAFRRHKNLAGFTHRALDWLVVQSLNADQRRDLLKRLRRPDHRPRRSPTSIRLAQGHLVVGPIPRIANGSACFDDLSAGLLCPDSDWRHRPAMESPPWGMIEDARSRQEVVDIGEYHHQANHQPTGRVHF